MWHGIFLFLLGLLTGLGISALTNPRMGLAAHLEGVMNGILLVILGLIWKEISLPARAAAALFWLALFGTYANWGTTLLGAVFGTSKLTPIAGAGYAGAAWQEIIVAFGLVSVCIAMVLASAFVLWGLRRRTG